MERELTTKLFSRPLIGLGIFLPAKATLRREGRYDIHAVNHVPKPVRAVLEPSLCVFNVRVTSRLPAMLWD